MFIINDRKNGIEIPNHISKIMYQSSNMDYNYK